MNITVKQLRALRVILSKQNRETIAKQAGMSMKSVEAVLQGTRRNDKIEQLVVTHAEINLAEVENVITDVKSKNKESYISTNGYEDAINSVGWARGRNYFRHIDVYLQLSHIKFHSPEDLWETITREFRDLIQMDYYCVEVIRRVMGIPPSDAVKFYCLKTS